MERINPTANAQTWYFQGHSDWTATIHMAFATSPCMSFLRLEKPAARYMQNWYRKMEFAMVDGKFVNKRKSGNQIQSTVHKIKWKSAFLIITVCRPVSREYWIHWAVSHLITSSWAVNDEVSDWNRLSTTYQYPGNGVPSALHSGKTCISTYTWRKDLQLDYITG